MSAYGIPARAPRRAKRCPWCGAGMRSHLSGAFCVGCGWLEPLAEMMLESMRAAELSAGLPYQCFARRGGRFMVRASWVVRTGTLWRNQKWVVGNEATCGSRRVLGFSLGGRPHEWEWAPGERSPHPGIGVQECLACGAMRAFGLLPRVALQAFERVLAARQPDVVPSAAPSGDGREVAGEERKETQC